MSLVDPVYVDSLERAAAEAKAAADAAHAERDRYQQVLTARCRRAQRIAAKARDVARRTSVHASAAIERAAASADKKHTAVGAATPCAPMLPVPASSAEVQDHQWDPQWGPHCDDWVDDDAPQRDPQWDPDSEEWDVPHDARCRRFTYRGEPDPPEYADVATDTDPRMIDADQIPPPSDPNRRLNPRRVLFPHFIPPTLAYMFPGSVAYAQCWNRPITSYDDSSDDEDGAPPPVSSLAARPNSSSHEGAGSGDGSSSHGGAGGSTGDGDGSAGSAPSPGIGERVRSLARSTVSSV